MLQMESSFEHKFFHNLYIDNNTHILSSDYTNEEIRKADTDALANVILPYCGKRCFNRFATAAKKQIVRRRAKPSDTMKRQNDGGTGVTKRKQIGWNNDARVDVNGDIVGRSSLQAMVDWFCIEENAEKYFGGSVGNEGSKKILGKTKDYYYLQVQAYIEKETGNKREISTIRSKWQNVLLSYKNAEDTVQQSGNGLEEGTAKYISFYDMILRICPFYWQLHEVLATKPNILPAILKESGRINISASPTITDGRTMDEDKENNSDKDNDCGVLEVRGGTPCSSSSTITEPSQRSLNPIDARVLVKEMKSKGGATRKKQRLSIMTEKEILRQKLGIGAPVVQPEPTIVETKFMKVEQNLKIFAQRKELKDQGFEEDFIAKYLPLNEID